MEQEDNDTNRGVPFEALPKFLYPEKARMTCLPSTPISSTGELYVFRFPTTRVMVLEDGDDIETIDFDLPEQAESCPLPENVESISRKTAEILMRVVEGAKNAIVQYVIRSRNKIRQMESCIQERDVEIAELRSEVARLQQNVRAQTFLGTNPLYINKSWNRKLTRVGDDTDPLVEDPV